MQTILDLVNKMCIKSETNRGAGLFDVETGYVGSMEWSFLKSPLE
jgi:hypothetical protein